MAVKRDFGVSTLLGSGLGLIVTLTWFFLLTDDVRLSIVIATVTAGVLSGAFVFVGYWMYHTGIGEDTVWTVARWSLVGLAVPTLAGVVLLNVDLDPVIGTLFPGVFINVIAVGGVLGLLLGLVVEMHREQSELRRLNQRNQLLNRVLRHNIRNDMHVVQWHLDMLVEGVVEDEATSIDAIQHKVDEAVRTSDTARRVDELDAESTEVGPVNVVEIVEERVEIVRTTHPEVAFDVDCPARALADVGPVCESVVDNVVENAVEHHDGVPHIEVTVEAPADRSSPVRLVVVDDGPGIPDHELELLGGDAETQLEEATGLGLWLIGRVVEHFDGTLQIDAPDSGGTCVEIEVPAAADGDASPIRKATPSP
jgi:signal transduction histidine kinase